MTIDSISNDTISIENYCKLKEKYIKLKRDLWEINFALGRSKPSLKYQSNNCEYFKKLKNLEVEAQDMLNRQEEVISKAAYHLIN